MLDFGSIFNSPSIRLSALSPYSFVKGVDDATLRRETIVDPLLREIAAGTCEVMEVTVSGEQHFFVFKKLTWDSDYFAFPIYSLLLVTYRHASADIVAKALREFVGRSMRGRYLSFNVPAADTVSVQALCLAGFRLVETRLHYHLENVQLQETERYQETERHGVRLAGPSDIPELRQVAMKMRNQHDRVHADPAFTPEQADAYLGTFIEESVNGFADYVFVPEVENHPPFGFLAATKPVAVVGANISRLVLAAIDSSVQRGWLYYLLQAVIDRAKKDGANYLTTITQAANKPAIRIWEKSGFRLGAVTHVFSISDRQVAGQ